MTDIESEPTELGTVAVFRGVARHWAQVLGIDVSGHRGWRQHDGEVTVAWSLLVRQFGPPVARVPPRGCWVYRGGDVSGHAGACPCAVDGCTDRGCPRCTCGTDNQRG